MSDEREFFEAWWEGYVTTLPDTMTKAEMERLKDVSRSGWLVGIKDPPVRDDEPKRKKKG